jgi:protein tyrosine phosphatase (PTP) superfamily phosphohydrolase (DUF442 family)
MAIPRPLRWFFGLAIAALLVVVPTLHYRAVYAHSKRLREVRAGVLYRSGCLTANGFRDAVQRYGIRTIINLQDEFADPELDTSYWSRRKIKETELCRELGVRYIHLPPDLISRQRVPAERPAAIDRFLQIMDDPSHYPVLIHCKAGLHRTGVIAAVYRMEYEQWTPQAAIAELKALGFGYFPCTSANDYIKQYVLTYRPGTRVPAAGLTTQGPNKVETKSPCSLPVRPPSS